MASKCRVVVKCVQKPASFGQCLVAQLTDNHQNNEVTVRFDFDNNILNLTPHSQGIVLHHPSFCPVLHLSDADRAAIPYNTLSRGVGVSVCIILSSSDHHVLLTRRAKHMRTFRGVWVPPGGGVEVNESLIDAGMRELREETGLQFHEQDVLTCRPLCLFESVFPIKLQRGLPTRQQMVVYFYCQVSLSSKEIQPEIVLNPEETDANMWITREMAKAAIEGTSVQTGPLLSYELLDKSGTKCVEKDWDLLFAKLPQVQTEDVERLSTGTVFALSHWLKQ